MPRFMVVDDDPSAVRGVTLLLRDDGHDVVPFTNAAAAIDAVPHQRLDAVITDLEMPDVDGHAVVRAVRKHQPHACLVVVTGRTHENFTALVSAGACMVADKPMKYDAVVQHVRSCRERGGPPSHGGCPMRAQAEELVRLRRK